MVTFGCFPFGRNLQISSASGDVLSSQDRNSTRMFGAAWRACRSRHTCTIPWGVPSSCKNPAIQITHFRIGFVIRSPTSRPGTIQFSNSACPLGGRRLPPGIHISHGCNCPRENRNSRGKWPAIPPPLPGSASGGRLPAIFPGRLRNSCPLPPGLVAGVLVRFRCPRRFGRLPRSDKSTARQSPRPAG